MRLTDLVFCFPPIILAMAIAAALGIGTINTDHRHAGGVVAEIRPACAQPGASRSVRMEYVEAAQSIGFGPAHILLRQIIPNAVGPLVVLVTLDLGNAILVFAGLSFLGLGVVPPTPEWGAMVAEGRELVQQWWVATFPGLAILTVVMGFNFVGDGVRDWLDPHARTAAEALDPAGARSAHLVPDRCRARPRRRRRQLRPACRRDAGHRRRIRLRQERLRQVDHAPAR